MVMVPPRATSFLQLDDIAVNAGFKSEFGRAYRGFFDELARKHSNKHDYDQAEEDATTAGNLRQLACEWTARAIAQVRSRGSAEKGIRRLNLDQWDHHARIAEEIGDDLWRRDEESSVDVVFVEGDPSRARRYAPPNQCGAPKRTRSSRGGKKGHGKCCGVCGRREHNKRTCAKRTEEASATPANTQDKVVDPTEIQAAEERALSDDGLDESELPSDSESEASSGTEERPTKSFKCREGSL